MLQKPTSIKFVCFCFVWRYVSIFFTRPSCFVLLLKELIKQKSKNYQKIERRYCSARLRPESVDVTLQLLSLIWCLQVNKLTSSRVSISHDRKSENNFKEIKLPRSSGVSWRTLYWVHCNRWDLCLPILSSWLKNV